jgi:hypothetical protein
LADLSALSGARRGCRSGANGPRAATATWAASITSTRRLEITVEQLMNKTSGQALELNKRGNLIKRLKLVS